ncbi:VIT1/CCC1 transporter family protein [Melioribacteraceae bacterium 4301-Me]|uniref:VIT1/CCC1 transporter family protein n=1 Tax=Pyranulibacter aquaticus TaxID=3163344 RepID=UPI003595C53E
MIDSSTKKMWQKHLQGEIDSAYLYRVLASLIDDEKKKNIYLQIAEIEDKHVNAWKNQFSKSGIKNSLTEPSTKAKIFAWYSKKFNTYLLEQYMLKNEASEVKSYFDLYNNASEISTKTIALQLARDSAEHANSLMQTGGVNEEPWHSSESGGLLRNVVYGFNDGLTANFGLIAGMIGAAAHPQIILISGMAGMIADALSMGSSGYLAAVSEKEVYDYERKMEAEEIKLMPELETEELALIYEAKGLNSAEARRRAVEAMKNPQQVLEDKVKEELGIVKRSLSPFKEGWVTGVATAIGAFIPVFPFFFFSGGLGIWTSFIISMVAHFAVGAARSFFTGRGIFRSGFDMFVVGFGVAAVGYILGELILKFL